MEILMTTLASQTAQELAADLDREGHVIRTCSEATGSQAIQCAALRNEACPLDAYPIDAAVEVGVLRDDGLANGGLCAVRRQVPLVLVDCPGDALEPWAAASVARSDVTTTIAALGSSELPAHTAVARRTLDDELGQRRTDEAETDVVVRRRNGGLLVELSPGGMSERDSEKLVVHVAQRIRAFDPWARTIDVCAARARES